MLIYVTAQALSTNHELQKKLAQYEGYFLQVATALNEHSQKIHATEQNVALIGNGLQPANDISLSERVKDIDNREQVASERITMLEERTTNFEEQISEVSSILGNEPMMPGEGEPTDLITRRVASLEQQNSKTVTSIAKTSELVSKLSLAQTVNRSTAIDTAMDTDIAAALNARIDDVVLRVDKLERTKLINDSTSLRPLRQQPGVRGGSGPGRRGYTARGGNSSRNKTQEQRKNWTPYPDVPKDNDSQLVDVTKSSVTVQPVSRCGGFLTFSLTLYLEASILSGR